MSVLMCEYMEIDTVFQVGSHYYAKNFTRDGYTVNWVNQPKTYLANNKNTTIRVNDSLTVTNPKVFLPFCKYPLLNSKFWANNYLDVFTRNIKDQMELDEVDLLWMTNVKMHKVSEAIKYNKMIHRMADDFSGFTGAYKNMIYLQNEVIKKSDIVFVSAKNLLDRVYKFNKNVFYLPNGVDLERFKNIGDSIPEDIARISMPKVIYVGAMEDWFDYELITSAAERLRDVAFIMIGNISDTGRKAFNGYNNIYLLGKKPHEEIPKYLKNSDVGIMPFIENSLTNSIHPLKVYEYFASGIPVISRDLEEVREMNSPAMLYKNKEEFIHFIKELIREKKDLSVFEEYVQRNSWNSRYEKAKEYINSNR